MKPIAVALAVLFFALAVLAILHPLPGGGIVRALGFSSDKAHAKHAILYVVLGLLALVWLRFQSAEARA